MYERSVGDEHITHIYQLIISGDIPSSQLVSLKEEALSMCKQNPELNMANASICVGAFYYGVSNTDSAYYYFNDVVTNHLKSVQSKLLADVYYKMTILSLMKGDFEQAPGWIEKVYALFEKEEDLNFLGKYYYAKGIIERDKNQKDKAIEFYKLAEKEFETVSNYNEMVRTYCKISLLESKNGDIDAATNYLEKALEYENKTSISTRVDLYYQLLHLMEDRFNGSYKENDLLKKISEHCSFLENIRCVAAVNIIMAKRPINNGYQDNDSAIYYLNKSLVLNKKLKDDRNIAICYHNLLLAYSKKNNYQTATMYADSAINIYRSYKQTKRLASIHIDLANYFSERDKYSLADDYFDSVQLFVSKTKNIALLNKYYYHYPLHLIKKGDFENAYYQSQIFKTINDSLVQKENQSKLDELLIKFETEKKEKENLLLSQSLLLEKEDNKANKTYKWYAIYLGGGLFILLLIMIHIYIYKRRDAKNSLKLKNEKLLRLKKENELIEQQSINATNQLEVRNNLFNVINNHLLQQSMLSAKFVGWLKKLKPFVNIEGMKLIQSNLAEVGSVTVDQNWNTFEQNFSEIYPGFHEKIQKENIELSMIEFRVLCFLIMKLNNNDISRLSFQSLNGIRVAKFRLRKKFEVETDKGLLQKVGKLTGYDIG